MDGLWKSNFLSATNFTFSGTGNLSYGLLADAGGGGSSGNSTDLGWTQVARTLAAPITNSGTYFIFE